ncbi:hypothetical protein H0H87_002503 [Tephrocybe sp. NHM501043]|nr:hypothetical protein H0H87_002503 [Tephrocybe sp. NHM501043]
MLNYIKGKDNSVADAMSRLPSSYEEPEIILAPVFSMSDNTGFMNDLMNGYQEDSFAARLLVDAKANMLPTGVEIRDNLIYV